MCILFLFLTIHHFAHFVILCSEAAVMTVKCSLHDILNDESEETE